MPVITPEDAPTFDMDNATITGLASPTRGSAEIAAWRIQLKAGHASPVHSLDREEVFVVLDGSLTVRYEDASETAHAGGALIVAPERAFSIEGEGEAVCVFPVGGTAALDGQRIVPPWAV